MIPVAMADEPASFDALVRQPGRIVLLELAGSPEAPKRRGRKRVNQTDYWTRALPEMRQLYRRTCAYLAMYIHRGTGRDTVDHFLPKTPPSRNSYEWSNFRYASLDVNRLKDQLPFLDPFQVRPGWLVLNLVSFKLEAGVPVPTGQEAAWEATLKVLNDPTFCDARLWYHERYFGRKLDESDPDEPMTLATLTQEAPFVAQELRRQDRLKPGDT